MFPCLLVSIIRLQLWIQKVLQNTTQTKKKSTVGGGEGLLRFVYHKRRSFCFWCGGARTHHSHPLGLSFICRLFTEIRYWYFRYLILKWCSRKRKKNTAWHNRRGRPRKSGNTSIQRTPEVRWICKLGDFKVITFNENYFDCNLFEFWVMKRIYQRGDRRVGVWGKIKIIFFQLNKTHLTFSGDSVFLFFQ